jgi:hypothetical protein
VRVCVRQGSTDETTDQVHTLREGSHEIAYIFGQLSSPYSIPSLLYVMRDPNEDDMVRHEAAEALGGIASEFPPGDVIDLEQGGEIYEQAGDREQGVLGILKQWAGDGEAPEVVRESCQVAVDMYEVGRRRGVVLSLLFNSLTRLSVCKSTVRKL